MILLCSGSVGGGGGGGGGGISWDDPLLTGGHGSGALSSRMILSL